MSRIGKLRQLHNEHLEECCKRNGIKFKSIQNLLEAQKTKKFLKRNALMQQNIEREINNIIANEN